MLAVAVTGLQITPGCGAGSEGHLENVTLVRDNRAAMQLQSLLLCHDPDAVARLRKALEDTGINVEVCAAVEPARELLAQQKFDAVFVDVDDLPGSPEVLKELRNGSSNRNSIVFGITNGQTSVNTAFGMGANFVLEKPLTPERTARILHTARSLIESERRRYFRVPVESLVTIRPEKGGEHTVTATNLSGGGMAVRVAQPLPERVSLWVAFRLPGMKQNIEAQGDVAWTDSGGHTGIRFRFLPMKSRQALQEWLERQADEAIERKGGKPKRRARQR